MHWETLYCPNRHCCCYGLPFDQGWLVQHGSRHGKPQALCQACGRRMALTYGTAYFGLAAAPAIFARAVRAVAEGNALHATARIIQRDQETVCTWVHRAAHPWRWVLLAHWQHLHVTEGQWDAWWRFVHTQADHVLTAKRRCERYGDAWRWGAFSPTERLVVAFVVGTRTEENAHLLLQRVVAVTDAPLPFFTSDQLPAYAEALLAVYGQWTPPARHGKRGRYPAPRRMPLPNLRYAQVVKRRDKGRVVAGRHTGVFGEAQQVEGLLAASASSTTIHTSFVER